MLNTLVQLSELVHRPQPQQRLEASLLQAATKSDDVETARTCRIAQIVLLWSWEQVPEAINRLQEELRVDADNRGLKTMVLRATLQSGDLPRSQQWSTELMASTDDRTETRYLQKELWKRWTAQTHWRDLVGHEGAVSALAVHPDGK